MQRAISDLVPRSVTFLILVLMTGGALSTPGCGDGSGDDGGSGTTPPGGTTPTPAEPTPAGTPAPLCAEPDPALDLDYLLFIPDNETALFKFMDARTGVVLEEISLSVIASDMCASGCFIFGAHQQVIDGEDYASLAFGAPHAKETLLSTGFHGRITQVPLRDPLTPRWTLEALDFSGLPGELTDYCAALPEDPCQGDPAEPIETRGLCWVGDAHDFEILEDDAENSTAEILVADTDNHRLLRVVLDYSTANTCGKVVSILDSRHPDWYPASQPNNLVRLARDGREFFLVTMRSVEDGSYGEGLLQFWEYLPGGDWELHWTFPEQEDGAELRYVRSLHGGEWIEDGLPEGDLIRFASSATFTTGEDGGGMVGPGSIAVLLSASILEPPDYLYDIYLNSEDVPFGYPRSINRIDARTMLVTDSGCQITGGFCPSGPSLFWLPDTLDYNSPLPGYWTPELDQMDLIDMSDQVLRRMECGLVNPYWSQVIRPDELGATLEQRLADHGLSF